MEISKRKSSGGIGAAIGQAKKLKADDLDPMDEDIPMDTDDAGPLDDVKDADLAVGGEESWGRPKLPSIVPQRDGIGNSDAVCRDGPVWCCLCLEHIDSDLVSHARSLHASCPAAMQLLDADYTIAGSVATRPGIPARQGKVPIIRLYGVTEQGNSVMMLVHDFMPYFWVPCWPGFMQEDAKIFGSALNVTLCLVVHRFQCTGWTRSCARTHTHSHVTALYLFSAAVSADGRQSAQGCKRLRGRC